MRFHSCGIGIAFTPKRLAAMIHAQLVENVPSPNGRRKKNEIPR
jgi:hypothetical protein